MPTRVVTNLYNHTHLQVIDRTWDVEELLARSEHENAQVWADDEELTFFYQGKADSVQICCGIQLPMVRIDNSENWALTVQIDDLDKAVISYSFIPYQNGRPMTAEEELKHPQVWRGPQAPTAPERAQSLQGQISRYVIHSPALGDPRQITVYLPPDHHPGQRYPVVYGTDGQFVNHFAPLLDYAIAKGETPPTIVVGVHSAAYTGEEGDYDPGQDLRSQEYMLGENQKRFDAHEQFFVYEVSVWAETSLGASPNRKDRAIFGFSNGGAFAVSMGIRHPDIYGTIIAFSVGESQQGWGTPKWTENNVPRHYLAAGTLEPFLEPTARWAAKLTQIGVEHIYHQRVSGHDRVMWEEELLFAIAWAFHGH